MSKQQNLNKSSTKLIRSIQLTIHSILPGIDQPFIDKYKVIFDTLQFTHLTIDYPTISDEMLVKMVQLLRNLDSLKLSSLQLTRPDCSCGNVANMYFPTSINSKITKVYLKEITDMEQVNFLLFLCHYVEHFQVHVSRTMDLDMLLRLILIKISTDVPQLRSLCLCVPNAHEGIIHQLENLVESERLLSNYMIKRSGNNVLLKWN
jgi:hypothetical protein